MDLVKSILAWHTKPMEVQELQLKIENLEGRLRSVADHL